MSQWMKSCVAYSDKAQADDSNIIQAKPARLGEESNIKMVVELWKQ